MKRIMISLMALALLTLLCACGETEQTAAQTTAPASEEVTEEKAPEMPEEAAAQEPAREEQEETIEEAPEEAATEASEEQSLLETALTFVDHDAGELIAAIGEPQEKAYEESCSGPGEDGIWTYDGFTVFTYLENGVETIIDAE